MSATTETHDDLPVVFSQIPDVYGNEIQQQELSWVDVRQKLTDSQVYESKHACPLFKLATFGGHRTEKGSLRSDENLEQISGVEGDYDGEVVSEEQAADLLASHGIEAFIYTSASHSDSAPRWRVVAPLSSPCSKAERRALVGMLNAALGGILSTESFTDSQSYYYGRVKGAPFRFKHVRGATLDNLRYVLEERYPEKGAASGKPRSTEESDLARKAAIAEITADTILELRSAISALKTHRADDYVSWITIGHAIKSVEQAGFAGEALGLWFQFSALSEKFDDEVARVRWEGFNANRNTYKTIFKLAQADGWTNPKSTEALKTNATSETRRDHTDAGNVALLATITKGDLRYVPEHKMWLRWNGERWERDEYGTFALAAALQVAEHYHREAAKIRKQSTSTTLDTADRRRLEKVAENIVKWASRCRSKGGLDNMLNLAKSDSRFTLPADQLDCDPMLLGVANGVVDLRTGDLRPDGRDEFVTKRSPVRFDPTSTAPRFEQFVEEVTAEPVRGAPGVFEYKVRPALAVYLQCFLGYSLTGHTQEQKMFILIGEGANGKNVLLDLLQMVMGDYCVTIAPEALMASRHDADAERATPGARRLAGARVAISSECKDGQRLDVVLVKRQTGGGYMTARGLHENTFTFIITHKLVMMTNYKPALDHLDPAVRGRLHLIPFDMGWNRPGHPDPNPLLPEGDKALPEKLQAELEGVMAWLVAGAVRYARDGLEPPDEVVRMTKDYFKDQDPVAQWLEQCEVCDPRAGAKASDLLEHFGGFCLAEGYSKHVGMSPKAFSNVLSMRGVGKHLTKEGTRYGLQVRQG
jgi:putative DNA primase/helicase